MGTRGYRVYRYRGRYYAVYNQYDSYPSGLGNELIATIPEDFESYQEWLRAKRAEFEAWDKVLCEQVLCLQAAELQALPPPPSAELGNSRYRGYHEYRHNKLLDERLHQQTPSYQVTLNDLYIEWVYTIDLDNEVFSIDNSAHFVLYKIPRNVWMESLAEDRLGFRLVLPHIVPPDSIAYFSRVKPGILADASSAYAQDLTMQIVKPKRFSDFPDSHRHGPVLLEYLWIYLQRSIKDQMTHVLRTFSPTDFAFREIAFGIISLAAGLVGGIQIEDARRLKKNVETDWKALVIGRDVNGPTAVVSQLAFGYHLQGVEPGSAPEETCYWFRGVLVLLETGILHEDSVKNAITRAVYFGRSTQPELHTFNALLISIEHVVILRVVDDHIQHTHSLPLLEVSTYYTDHPLARYDAEERKCIQGWEDTGDVKEYVDNKNINQGLSSSNIGREEHEQSGFGSDSEGALSESSYEPANQTLCAMIHLFEASTLQTMRPLRLNEGLLPDEVLEMVLAEVDDETYRACAFVSRKFRSYCLQNLRIVPGTIIRGLAMPVFADTADEDILASELSQTQSDGGKRSIVHIQGLQSSGDQELQFALEDRDTGLRGCYEPRQTWLDSEVNHSTKWITTCGDSNRLSLIATFYFLKFLAPIEWDRSREQYQHQNVTSDSWIDPRDLWIDRNIVVPPETEEGQGHYWAVSRPRGRDFYGISDEDNNHSAALFEIWKHIFRHYQIFPSTYLSPSSLPPHTRFLSVIHQRHIPGGMVIAYVRIKRPSPLCGLAQCWERARSELETELRDAAATREFKRIFGITAVNLAARLFRYDAESAKLVQLVDRELQVFAEGDREVVETFVLGIKDPLHEIVEPAREPSMPSNG